MARRSRRLAWFPPLSPECSGGLECQARPPGMLRSGDGRASRATRFSGPGSAPLNMCRAVARAREDPGAVMRPSTLLHAVVVAAYNEPGYDVVADEYALAPDRARQSFQPISLYITNIWEAPAPSRVVASANCFWNLTTTVRPLALRKFASHSQPLTALIDMGFWSTEDDRRGRSSSTGGAGSISMVTTVSSRLGLCRSIRCTVLAGAFQGDDGRPVQAAQLLHSQWCLLTGRYRERFDVTRGETCSSGAGRRAA